MPNDTVSTDPAWVAKIPTGLWVAIGITALMVYRLMAVTFLPEVGNTVPEMWGVAFRGDTFIGATALIIAYLLWKSRGLAVWTIAIVWHWIGIKDFASGIEFHFIEPFDPSMGNTVLVPLIGGPILQLIAVYLLVRHRRVYLGSV